MRRSNRKRRGCESASTSRCRSFRFDYYWTWIWGSSTTRVVTIELQSRRRAEEIYIRRVYNVRKYGERFKKSLHLAARKGTEISSNFISTLTWTFRLQSVTKESHHITLRLKSMKMCVNYFEKRVSILLEKIFFEMTTFDYAFSFSIDIFETNYVRVSVSRTIMRCEI